MVLEENIIDGTSLLSSFKSPNPPAIPVNGWLLMSSIHLYNMILETKLEWLDWQKTGLNKKYNNCNLHRMMPENVPY